MIDMISITNIINEPSFQENFLLGFICGYIITLIMFLMLHEVSYVDAPIKDKKTK